MSRAIAVAVLSSFLLASSVRAEPRWMAPQRARSAWSAVRSAVSKAATRIGDRLVLARGPQAALERVERLYDRGELGRSLGVLDRMLRSDRVKGPQLDRALLYAATIQTQLGNHAQAVSAFAGLAQRQPDFALPAGASDQVQHNLTQGQWVAYSGAVRNERNAAKQPGALSLTNRLVFAGRALKERVQSAIRVRPKLMALYGKTVGRLVTWRALNALERQGVPRFKVNLLPDAADPWGGKALRDGRVDLDYSTTLSYQGTVAALAHEALHLNQPLTITEGGRLVEKHFAAASKVADIWAQGRQTPRTARAARRQLAGQLREQRGILRSLGRQLDKLGLREEGLADRFSGRILARENLPVTQEGWKILGRTPDALHPKPQRAYQQYTAGVNEVLSEQARYAREAPQLSPR